MIFRYANVEEFISYCRAPVLLHTVMFICSIRPGFTHIQAHRHTVTYYTLWQTCTLIATIYLCLISMQRGVPVPVRQVYPYELNACNPNLTPDTLIHVHTQMHRSSCPWNQVEHLNRSTVSFFYFCFTFSLFFSFCLSFCHAGTFSLPYNTSSSAWLQKIIHHLVLSETPPWQLRTKSWI